MRHSAVFAITILVLALVAVAAPVHAQAAFKIPFAFESGGKKLPAGDYVVTKTGDAPIHVPAGVEREGDGAPVHRDAEAADAAGGRRRASPSTRRGRSSRPTPSTSPSTSWPRSGCRAQEGYLVHVTKGAHKEKVVTGEARKKEPRP